MNIAWIRGWSGANKRMDGQQFSLLGVDRSVGRWCIVLCAKVAPHSLMKTEGRGSGPSSKGMKVVIIAGVGTDCSSGQAKPEIRRTESSSEPPAGLVLRFGFSG